MEVPPLHNDMAEFAGAGQEPRHPSRATKNELNNARSTCHLGRMELGKSVTKHLELPILDNLEQRERHKANREEGKTSYAKFLGLRQSTSP